MIAFYGIVSGYRAKYTRLTWEDVALLDDALWNAIPVMASTRSKVGQRPRLLLRLEYRDAHTFLGDLRGKIAIAPAEGLRDIADFEVDCSSLLAFLGQQKEKIARVLVLEDPELRVKNSLSKEELKNSLWKEELQKVLGEAVDVVSSV